MKVSVRDLFLPERVKTLLTQIRMDRAADELEALPLEHDPLCVSPATGENERGGTGHRYGIRRRGGR